MKHTPKLRPFFPDLVLEKVTITVATNGKMTSIIVEDAEQLSRELDMYWNETEIKISICAILQRSVAVR